MLSYSSWGKILLGRCVDPQVSAQKMIPTGYLYNRGDVIISGRQYEVQDVPEVGYMVISTLLNTVQRKCLKKGDFEILHQLKSMMLIKSRVCSFVCLSCDNSRTVCRILIIFCQTSILKVLVDLMRSIFVFYSPMNQ